MSVVSSDDERTPKQGFCWGSMRRVFDDRIELISMLVDLTRVLEEEVYVDVPSENEVD
jgi:hypothetical protein